jgi:glyoxylase-like metal-dependent hydrolase (beta-lactamase superfamily II)
VTEAIRLGRSVWLVGSGELGFGLTSPWDSNVHLVQAEPDWLVVDAGCGRATAQIARNVERVTGGAPVRAILLTHAHADHAAGAAGLAAALGCEVLALPETAAILSSQDEERAGLTGARAAGTYPPDQTLPRCQVEVLTAGRFAGLDVIPTAGHADGHAAYAVRDGDGLAVFTGDLVFSRGRLAVLETPDTDREEFRRSLVRLADLRPDRLYPGHAEPVLSRARECLHAAIANLDSEIVSALT